jgi:RimJ/RimL family protein N-acetyltransferase
MGLATKLNKATAFIKIVIKIVARIFSWVLLDRKPMAPSVKPGAALASINGPVIETERLILRQWRGSDIAPNTAMLSDPPTARFITIDGKPVTDELVGWRNAAVMAGHWVLYGAGMFVVEEKSSGKFAGRVGPWFPPQLARI